MNKTMKIKGYNLKGYNLIDFDLDELHYRNAKTKLTDIVIEITDRDQIKICKFKWNMKGRYKIVGLTNHENKVLNKLFPNFEVIDDLNDFNSIGQAYTKYLKKELINNEQ